MAMAAGMVLILGWVIWLVPFLRMLRPEGKLKKWTEELALALGSNHSLTGCSFFSPFGGLTQDH